jgi:hypothetical protein
MTTVAEIVEHRGITEVLHFTTNRGLTGILAKGAVLPRARLPEDKYLEHVYHPNADTRKDKAWLDYVNLSISSINTEFFGHSSRWHAHDDVWWCALAFNPAILSDDGVYFATTNNMYTGCRRALGPDGLEALFGDPVHQYLGHYARRTDDMGDEFTTCHQAEALYPGPLSLERLLRVYVATGPHADVAASSCAMLLGSDDASDEKRTVPVVIDAEVFEP